MKKLLYVLPLIGFLAFMSCDKDESDEIIDDILTLDDGQIEIVENSDNKGPFSIVPGLYGPNNVTALQNVTYTYIPSQEALNTIPKDKRNYRIYFKIENPNSQSIDPWWQIAYYELPSNKVTFKFPVKWGGSYDWTGKVKDWQIIYEIYGYTSQGFKYFRADKVVTVNH